MENSEHRFLAEAPAGKLMRRYAMPCVISLLVGALYNIVDQIFIANASYLGSFGNAANTVVFPMTVIALAIAVMIGDGCSAACCCVRRWSVRSASFWWRDPRAPSSAFSARQMRACTIRTSLCAPSTFICACLCLPVSTRPVSSSCRPWERRRPPRRCLWCVRSSSASASHCSCRCSGDWTAYCGPCRSRIS